MPVQDYYDTAEDQAPMPKDNAPDEKGEADESKMVLVNSEVCPGLKPGDKLPLRVTEVMDTGEYHCAYDEGGGEDKGGEGEMTDEAPMPESPMYQ
jgi:hypothetical protein